jgi:hypothetical protein
VINLYRRFPVLVITISFHGVEWSWGVRLDPRDSVQYGFDRRADGGTRADNAKLTTRGPI